VESVQGQGSRFTILLPWEGQTNLVDPNSQLARLKLKSSLTIEYNPLDAEYLRDYLETLGIKNVIHALGEGAVEMASRLQPDVIFIDLFMPDGSGMEILEQLKGNPRTRDILVVITSIAEQHSQARAFGAGGYLLKPFTLEDLRQELDKATGYTTPSRQSPLNSSQVSLPLVLVVDDHEALLETIEDTLKRQQLEISIARSGNEMLEMVNEVLPGLILIDIHTPGMDGLEAIQRLRAHPDARVGSVPILAVSSLITPGDRERCLAAGATEYISKPFYLPELTEKVLVLLKK
jgi:CheY-like chemotaxis protein